MSDRAILVLDAGTTSTRALLFTPAGQAVGSTQEPLTQHHPKPGWVEQDAAEIRDKTISCARAMIKRAGGADRIGAIGIANQRETVIAWDRRTGAPLANAIVWQDRRTADQCDRLRAAGLEPDVQRRTGLLFDPYFSATKMNWLMENEPAVRDASIARHLAMGTVDSWLMFNLTGGAFVTDASNASRTCLLPLDGHAFDGGLCDLFDVPRSALPQIIDSAGELGTASTGLFGAPIPIAGIAGDQQAATIGQDCLERGQTKATYGTGAFILTNTGAQAPTSDNRLLATVLYQLHAERHYALEGSIFTAGSLVQWLRDSLGIIDAAATTEALARSIPDTRGVVIVPAWSGMGAPYWQPEARGLIRGLSFGAGKAEIARAALEAMAHQTLSLANAFAADGSTWKKLRIDGGMSANDWMAQDIADMLDLPVERPANIETTALGAAMLAAVGAGIYATLPEAARSMSSKVTRFDATMPHEERQRRKAAWDVAIAKV